MTLAKHYDTPPTAEELAAMGYAVSKPIDWTKPLGVVADGTPVVADGPMDLIAAKDAGVAGLKTYALELEEAANVDQAEIARLRGLLESLASAVDDEINLILCDEPLNEAMHEARAYLIEQEASNGR